MMRYFVFRDGNQIGQSLREGGAYSILLSNVCKTPGTYAIMTMTDEDYQERGREFDYRDAGNLQLTWDRGGHLLEVDQPLWTPERIEAWRARQPYTVKTLPKVRHFYMDFLEETVEGYCQGQTWNGWSVPYFTKAQLEKVIPALNGEDYGMDVHWCDKAEDSFEGLPVLRNSYAGDPDEDDEVWDAQRIEGVDEPVWSIGGFAWVWSSEDTPHTETENGWSEVTS
jgi:hypothetical protein